MKFPITWGNNVHIHKTIEAFKKELSSYETSKGTIKIPISKPIAFTLMPGMFNIIYVYFFWDYLGMEQFSFVLGMVALRFYPIKGAYLKELKRYIKKAYKNKLIE